MARTPNKFKVVATDVAFLLIALAFVVAALFPFLPASAREDGTMMPDGKSIQFIHGGKTDWWVQVQLLGEGGTEATLVEAKATDGPWLPLQRQNWTADGTWWAGAIHIPTGSDVRFRVTTPTVANFESCWFTHPAGVERCDD